MTVPLGYQLPTIDDYRQALHAAGISVAEGNQVRYLVDGWATYGAMFDALQTTLSPAGPAHFIYLLAWYVDLDTPLAGSGPSATTFGSMLQLCSNKGVQIGALLYPNPIPTQGTVLSAQFINRLANGVAIRDGVHLAYASHHQKVLLVKGDLGLVAFCGGLDISRDRVQPLTFHKGSPFHDVHCEIRGPGANALLKLFLDRWDANPDARQSEMDKHGKGRLRGRSYADMLTKRGEQLVAVATTSNLGKGSKGCQKSRGVKRAVDTCVRMAREFIYIEDQYLVEESVAKLLKEALGRVQHITILVPHTKISDLPGVGVARLRFVKALWAGPVEERRRASIYYRVSSDRGDLAAHAYVHSKTWIIDDQIALVGSANINRRGWSYDNEVVALIMDKPQSVSAPSLAQRLRMQLWSEHLGVDADQVRSGVLRARLPALGGSRSLWDETMLGVRVRRYTPAQFLADAGVRFRRRPGAAEMTDDEAMDQLLQARVPRLPVLWDSVWDPSGERLRPCSEGEKMPSAPAYAALTSGPDPAPESTVA